MLEPIEVDDLNDPRVDPYRNVRDADLRGRDRLFLAESELVIRRLLLTPERLHSLFLSPNKHERLHEAIDEARAAGGTFPVYVADVALISEIAGFHIHRGALAAGMRPTPEQLHIDIALSHLKSQQNVTLLLAEGVTNVDNMGALFRNAAAFGVDGVILDPTCCDPLYRKAIRVSVGHTLVVPYAVSTNWQADLLRLKQEWGLTLIGAEGPDERQPMEIQKRVVPLWQIPRLQRVGFLFGSESHGLAWQTRSACDLLAEIPMSKQVPSLNVAVAAAVVLYEFQRSRAADSGD